MSSAKNHLCEILDITESRCLDVAKKSRDAKPYSLLIAALIEQGEPMTLADVAKRFEEAGISSKEKALASLKRCKPARSPVYRDGDLYTLDPHDAEAELWAFRLGLRPPKVAPPPKIAPAEETPLPSAEEPLSIELLKQAWQQGPPHNFSALRVAICVLDTHGQSMEAERVLAFADACGPSQLKLSSAKYWRSNAPIVVRDDGLWELKPGHKAIRPARQALIDKLEVQRRYPSQRRTPEQMAETQQRWEQEQQERTEKLAQARRVLLYAYPPENPEALVLVDIGEHTIHTYLGEEIQEGAERLTEYDMLIALNVRQLLRSISVDPGQRRLGDLAATQKTMTINRRGKTLKLTTTLLIQGSCNIGRALGDNKKLREYLGAQKNTQLKRRLEANAKSLYALYQYGILQGAVRVRSGFIDEFIPAPWSHHDEERLYGLMKKSIRLGRPLEIVVGNAPGWEDPWARNRTAFVVESDRYPHLLLEDENGYPIDEAEIQLARVASLKDTITPILAKPDPFQADELARQAWQAPSRAAAIALAKEALTLCSDCADAYVVLGQESENLLDAQALFEEAVAAAKRVLAPEVFEHDAGHFWGLFETRPYMRAQAALAQSLQRQGRFAEAINIYQELLRLNPNDNQGIRELLAHCIKEEATG